MTIKEIAALAGVSTTTVSKIVNNKDISVNPETRQRVLRIVKEYNYRAYSGAITETAGKSFIIGILLSSLNNASEYIQGVIENAQLHGYGTIIYENKSSSINELKNITSLIYNHADAVLWDPVSIDSLENIFLFERASIPVLVTNQPNYTKSFFMDFRYIGYEMANKLIQLNHSKIVFVQKGSSSTSTQLLEGINKAFSKHDISVTANINIDLNCDALSLPTLIDEGYTAAICSSLKIAEMLSTKLSYLSVSIPKDFSILSLRNSDEIKNTSAKISCFDIPYREFGSQSAEYLIHTIETNSELHPPVFIPSFKLSHKNTIGQANLHSQKSIVVVGALNIDVTLYSEELPKQGLTNFIQTSFSHPGGKGLNQAVAISLLNKNVSLIGKVGFDYHAVTLLEMLKKYHVNTLGIENDSTIPTGIAYIFQTPDGKYSVSIQNGAGQKVSPEYVRSKKDLFSCYCLCVASTEIPYPSVLEAFRIAHEKKGITILNPVKHDNFPEELLNYTDIFVPDATKAYSLSGNRMSLDEQADYFLSKGVKHVIITFGLDGCYYKSFHHCDYYKLPNFSVIDVSGIEDAFIAALASYISNGYSIIEAIKIANIAAGYCGTQKGFASTAITTSLIENYYHLMQQRSDLNEKNQNNDSF